jgi:hypothetical protein
MLECWLFGRHPPKSDTFAFCFFEVKNDLLLMKSLFKCSPLKKRRHPPKVGHVSRHPLPLTFEGLSKKVGIGCEKSSTKCTAAGPSAKRHFQFVFF